MHRLGDDIENHSLGIVVSSDDRSRVCIGSHSSNDVNDLEISESRLGQQRKLNQTENSKRWNSCKSEWRTVPLPSISLITPTKPFEGPAFIAPPKTEVSKKIDLTNS